VHKHTLQALNYLYIYFQHLYNSAEQNSETGLLLLGRWHDSRISYKLSTLPWLTSEQLLHLPHFFAAPFSEVAKSRRYGIVMIPIQKCVG